MRNTVSRWLLVLALASMFSVHGCGGGTTESESVASTPDEVANPDQNDGTTDEDGSNTADDSLPQIVDNYYDQQFKYADVTLYKDESNDSGAYALSSTPTEDCSTILEEQMPDQISVVSVDTDEITIDTDGIQTTFISATQSEIGQYDMWGFYDIFKEHECAVTLSSGVTIDPATADFLGVGCWNDTFTDSCVAIYYRLSAYDFSSITIKQASGSTDETTIQTAAALKSIMSNIVE